jgi:hypothetical protein
MAHAEIMYLYSAIDTVVNVGTTFGMSLELVSHMDMEDTELL